MAGERIGNTSRGIACGVSAGPYGHHREGEMTQPSRNHRVSFNPAIRGATRGSQIQGSLHMNLVLNRCFLTGAILGGAIPFLLSHYITPRLSTGGSPHLRCSHGAPHPHAPMSTYGHSAHPHLFCSKSGYKRPGRRIFLRLTTEVTAQGGY